MQGHSDRILTTHVGSLPRTVEVLDAMKARRGGEDVDEAAYRQVVRDGVRNIVKRQVDLGIDVVADGDIVFSKQAEERFPEPNEIITALQARRDAPA